MVAFKTPVARSADQGPNLQRLLGQGFCRTEKKQSALHCTTLSHSFSLSLSLSLSLSISLSLSLSLDLDLDLDHERACRAFLFYTVYSI